MAANERQGFISKRPMVSTAEDASTIMLESATTTMAIDQSVMSVVVEGRRTPATN